MTLTNSHPSVYPGMLNDSVELFTVESKMNFINSGKVEPIVNLPFGIRQLTSEEIKKDPMVASALQVMHPNSEFKQQNQFLQCRFGGLDFTADIINNQFGEPDYWDCPKRATCQFNGIICKSPTYNKASISPLEIKFMKLLPTNLTNETISAELDLAFGSFHKFKQALYAKLGVQTKQEVALIAKSLNII